MSELILKGEKVILRPKRRSDASNDFRWRGDEELARLDASEPLRISFQDFLATVEAELLYSAPWSRRFAIDTLDHKHIGNCMHYDIDYIRGQTELGILIGEREYWAHGYGSDAVRTLLRHIFTSTPLVKVYLHTLEWNLRAQRAFQKCGFVPVKNVRRGGLTFVYMETHKKDWVELQRNATHPPEESAPSQ